jgi:uncharacterized protein
MYSHGMITGGLGLVLAAGMAAATPRSLAAQAMANEPPRPQIMTTGHGEAHIAPDRATVLISVETRGATAAAAGTDNATRQRATMDALRALGLQKSQLSTAGYNVQPEYNYSNPKLPRITDYVARNTVRAELRQLDQVGRAIDTALAAGATTIAGVQFWASNVDSARRVAIAAAVSQARDDADVMARAAGGTLGPLIELSGSPQMPGPRPIPVMRAMSAEAGPAPTSIEAGDLTITVDVTGRWQFVGK